MIVKLKIKKLYRLDSRHIIIEHYTFYNKNYFADENGNVYCEEKIISNNKPHPKTKTIEVRLYDDDGIKRRFKLHQIILQTFRPEGVQDGYTPDHINRLDRTNNSLSNLRWADSDIQYSNKDSSTHQYKKVFCFELNKEFNSCQEAEKELNLAKNTVSAAARGDIKSVRGYTFAFSI